MQIDGAARLVKMTVKEYSTENQSNKIYSVEAVEVEAEVSPVPEMVDADIAKGTRLLTGPTGLVNSLVQSIQDFNNYSNTDILKQETRGGFGPKSLTIIMNKDADMSTFLHEGWHFYLEAMTRLAALENAPQEIKDDLDAIFQWQKVQGETPAERMATWQLISIASESASVACSCCNCRRSISD